MSILSLAELISFKHFSLTLVLQFLGREFQNQRNHATSFKLILRVEKYVNEYVNLFFLCSELLFTVCKFNL